MIVVHCGSARGSALCHLYSWIQVNGVATIWSIICHCARGKRRARWSISLLHSCHCCSYFIHQSKSYSILGCQWGEEITILPYARKRKNQRYLWITLVTTQNSYVGTWYIVFLVSCFSTIFTLVCLNFAKILTLKVYFYHIQSGSYDPSETVLVFL